MKFTLRTVPAVFLMMITMTLPGSGQSKWGVRAPQRLIMNITDDPATAVALTWRSVVPAADAVVEYGVATAGVGFTKALTTVPAKRSSGLTEKKEPITHWSAVITGLNPATRYVYRVGRDSAWSEWLQFTTAEKTRTPFTFIWFGDPQDDISMHCTRVFREAYRNAPGAAFWMFSGDMTSEPEDKQLGELFYAGAPMFGMLPMAMVPGNHDMGYEMKDGEIVRNVKGKKQRTKSASDLWKIHYTLPSNGIPGYEEVSYTFDYQGVRFILLNTNDRLVEQAAWMEALLANNPNTWTVVSFHHPLYSSGRERDDKETRSAFQALFDRYAVDLVLTGHDHTYARSHKLVQDAVVPMNSGGTVYVNSSSGPKFYVYNPNYQKLMAKTAEHTQLFQVITAEQHRLAFKAYTAAGELFDAFELKK